MVTLVIVTDGDDRGSQVTNGNNQNGGDDSATAGTPTPTFVSRLPETDEIINPEATPAEVKLGSPRPGFAPAAPLSSESECQIGSSAVVLNWRRADPAGEQVIDLVSDFNDFAPGSYRSSQLLSAEVDSLTWKGLIPGVLYFWRVTTKLDGEWAPGESAQFLAEGCPQQDPA